MWDPGSGDPESDHHPRCAALQTWGGTVCVERYQATICTQIRMATYIKRAIVLPSITLMAFEALAMRFVWDPGSANWAEVGILGVEAGVPVAITVAACSRAIY